MEACAREERERFSQAQKCAAELEAKFKKLEAGEDEDEIDGLTLQRCNQLWREAKAKYR